MCNLKVSFLVSIYFFRSLCASGPVCVSIIRILCEIYACSCELVHNSSILWRSSNQDKTFCRCLFCHLCNVGAKRVSHRPIFLSLDATPCLPTAVVCCGFGCQSQSIMASNVEDNKHRQMKNPCVSQLGFTGKVQFTD